MRLEQVVVDSLTEIEPAIKAAKKGAAAASASGRMLGDGEIKNLGKKLAEAEEELARAVEGFRAFREQWETVDVSGYFGSEDYIGELSAALDDSGVDAHRLADVLYVYPALVRLDAGALAARIDKKIEARVRPSTLARILKNIQNRPSRFPAGRFLTSLFKVYKALGARNLRKGEEWAGKSMFLKDIYEILSAAPGSDYTEQEFVRDIYLLDASGEALEVRGHIASLEASSSTRDERKTLSIITRDGQRRLYSSICFNPVTR
ncbi:MAG: hypothetical protein Q7T82_08565 [Armatimonadota bacterium]|nr:hypothetical protein [Armatimonadota bacterium]